MRPWGKPLGGGRGGPPSHLVRGAPAPVRGLRSGHPHRSPAILWRRGRPRRGGRHHQHLPRGPGGPAGPGRVVRIRPREGRHRHRAGTADRPLLSPPFRLVPTRRAPARRPAWGGLQHLVGYVALFGGLALLTRRSLLAGVAYIALIEGVLGNIDLLLRKLTVVYHFRVL